MKRITLIILVAFICSLGVNMVAAETGHSHETTYAAQSCPVCNMMGHFTGTTKTDWGKLWYLFECPNGHRWWSQNP